MSLHQDAFVLAWSPKVQYCNSHMCCLFLICKPLLFSWIFIPLHWMPLALCWWHLGRGEEFGDSHYGARQCGIKKEKKNISLGRVRLQGRLYYSAHGWKFKLIDINHIFLRLLFSCFIPLKTNWDANHSHIILFMIFCTVLYMVSFLSYVQYLALNVKSMLKVTY